MILIDHPRPTKYKRFRRTSHCMSDLHGDAGTIELLRFTGGLGLKQSWLQNQGTPTEHFDLFDGVIDRALAAGAVAVSSRDLIVRVVQPKRVR